MLASFVLRLSYRGVEMCESNNLESKTVISESETGVSESEIVISEFEMVVSESETAVSDSKTVILGTKTNEFDNDCQRRAKVWVFLRPSSFVFRLSSSVLRPSSFLQCYLSLSVYMVEDTHLITHLY